MTFEEHKKQTADDCRQFAAMVTKLADTVEEGNMKEFEKFFFEGGTEEGDAKIFQLRELVLLRYAYREEKLDSTKKPNEKGKD